MSLYSFFAPTPITTTTTYLATPRWPTSKDAKFTHPALSLTPGHPCPLDIGDLSRLTILGSLPRIDLALGWLCGGWRRICVNCECRVMAYWCIS